MLCCLALVMLPVFCNEEEEEDEGICYIFRDGVLRIARGTGNCDKRALCKVVRCLFVTFWIQHKCIKQHKIQTPIKHKLKVQNVIEFCAQFFLSSSGSGSTLLILQSFTRLPSKNGCE